MGTVAGQDRVEHQVAVDEGPAVRPKPAAGHVGLTDDGVGTEVGVAADRVAVGVVEGILFAGITEVAEGVAVEITLVGVEDTDAVVHIVAYTVVVGPDGTIVAVHIGFKATHVPDIKKLALQIVGGQDAGG